MFSPWGRLTLRLPGIPWEAEWHSKYSAARRAVFSGWLANRTPMARWGEVEELAGAAIFLASDASSFVNGHILYVDGGITASL